MTFSLLLFVSSSAAWMETVRHYHRRRPVMTPQGPGWFRKGLGPTPAAMTATVLALGVVSWPWLAGRALRAGARHVIRWDIAPRWRKAKLARKVRKGEANAAEVAAFQAGGPGPVPLVVAPPASSPAAGVAGLRFVQGVAVTRVDGSRWFEELPV